MSRPFKKTPSTYHVAEIFEVCRSGPSSSRDGKTYVPARSDGLWTIGNRFRIAWLVFTGQADAVIWDQDQ